MIAGVSFSVVLLSKTDGNVLASAKVVKRTSLRGRMLAKWPAAVSEDRSLKCPQERPWRAPGGHAASITTISVRVNVGTADRIPVW
ncbi:hypothetical protein GCM10025331_34210 [Actinoplanes utahensis]|nr:hypothetical protein Aut01nite_47210 [Actinoplanes utahensis]